MLFLRVSVVALAVMTLVIRFDQGAAIACLSCKSTDDGNCSEDPDKIYSTECKSVPPSGTSIASTGTTVEETSGKDIATHPTVTTEEDDVAERETLTPTVTTEEETIEKATSTAAAAAGDADSSPEDELEENGLDKMNPVAREIVSRLRRDAPLSRADDVSVCYKLVYSKDEEEIVERGCAPRDNTCDKLRQEEGKNTAACYVCDNEDGCNAASSTITFGIISFIVSVGLVGIFGR